jgi:hypothetical protein
LSIQEKIYFSLSQSLETKHKTFVMNGLELKKAITSKAIENLEELHAELLEEADMKLHTGGAEEDESIVHGSFGESGSEDMSKETAQLRLTEADQIAESIRIFKNYRFEQAHEEVEPLALIQSNRGNFFVCKATKAVTIENVKYNLIGTDAPIYNALKGRKRGEKVRFNNMEFVVENVC